MGKIKYRTDIKAQCLRDNCKKRGWKWDKDEWNIFWALSGKCKSFFHREHGCRLKSDQFINHFPNSYILSRKDFMPGVLKRYVKELERRGENPPKLIPSTYVLPRDYALFLEEYNGEPEATWILKPCCRSQGFGIFLTTKLKRIKKLGRMKIQEDCGGMADNRSYVVCRYIDHPLLIGGKKFDMRMYVLVTSFKPLKAYLFKSGFCRFSVSNYYLDNGSLSNQYMHITNHSVQRRSRKYNKMHGEKWSTENLQLYLEGTIGLILTSTLFKEINHLIVHSLKAAQMVMSSNQHCFECYGYDIIIDCNLKPWLIEVNSSPSIVSNTPNDRILKQKLISNIFSIVLPPDGKPDVWWDKVPSDQAMDHFERLIDEDLKPWCKEKNEERRLQSHLLRTKGLNRSFSLKNYDELLNVHWRPSRMLKIKLRNKTRKVTETSCELRRNRSFSTLRCNRKHPAFKPPRHSFNGPYGNFFATTMKNIKHVPNTRSELSFVKYNQQRCKSEIFEGLEASNCVDPQFECEIKYDILFGGLDGKSSKHMINLRRKNVEISPEDGQNLNLQTIATKIFANQTQIHSEENEDLNCHLKLNVDQKGMNFMKILASQEQRFRTIAQKINHLRDNNQRPVNITKSNENDTSEAKHLYGINNINNKQLFTLKEIENDNLHFDGQNIDNFSEYLLKDQSESFGNATCNFDAENNFQNLIRKINDSNIGYAVNNLSDEGSILENQDFDSSQETIGNTENFYETKTCFIHNTAIDDIFKTLWFNNKQRDIDTAKIWRANDYNYKEDIINNGLEGSDSSSQDASTTSNEYFECCVPEIKGHKTRVVQLLQVDQNLRKQLCNRIWKVKSENKVGGIANNDLEIIASNKNASATFNDASNEYCMSGNKLSETKIVDQNFKKQYCNRIWKAGGQIKDGLNDLEESDTNSGGTWTVFKTRNNNFEQHKANVVEKVQVDHRTWEVDNNDNIEDKFNSTSFYNQKHKVAEEREVDHKFKNRISNAVNNEDQFKSTSSNNEQFLETFNKHVCSANFDWDEKWKLDSNQHFDREDRFEIFKSNTNSKLDHELKDPLFNLTSSCYHQYFQAIESGNEQNNDGDKLHQTASFKVISFDNHRPNAALSEVKNYRGFNREKRIKSNYDPSKHWYHQKYGNLVSENNSELNKMSGMNREVFTGSNFKDLSNFENRNFESLIYSNHQNKITKNPRKDSSKIQKNKQLDSDNKERNSFQVNSSKSQKKSAENSSSKSSKPYSRSSSPSRPSPDNFFKITKKYSHSLSSNSCHSSDGRGSNSGTTTPHKRSSTTDPQMKQRASLIINSTTPSNLENLYQSSCKKCSYESKPSISFVNDAGIRFRVRNFGEMKYIFKQKNSESERKEIKGGENRKPPQSVKAVKNTKNEKRKNCIQSTCEDGRVIREGVSCLTPSQVHNHLFKNIGQYASPGDDFSFLTDRDGCLLYSNGNSYASNESRYKELTALSKKSKIGTNKKFTTRDASVSIESPSKNIEAEKKKFRKSFPKITERKSFKLRRHSTSSSSMNSDKPDCDGPYAIKTNNNTAFKNSIDVRNCIKKRQSRRLLKSKESVNVEDRNTGDDNKKYQIITMLTSQRAELIQKRSRNKQPEKSYEDTTPFKSRGNCISKNDCIKNLPKGNFIEDTNISKGNAIADKDISEINWMPDKDLTKEDYIADQNISKDESIIENETKTPANGAKVINYSPSNRRRYDEPYIFSKTFLNQIKANSFGLIERKTSSVLKLRKNEDKSVEICNTDATVSKQNFKLENIKSGNRKIEKGRKLFRRLSPLNSKQSLLNKRKSASQIASKKTSLRGKKLQSTLSSNKVQSVSGVKRGYRIVGTDKKIKTKDKNGNKKRKVLIYRNSFCTTNEISTKKDISRKRFVSRRISLMVRAKLKKGNNVSTHHGNRMF